MIWRRGEEEAVLPCQFGVDANGFSGMHKACL